MAEDSTGVTKKIYELDPFKAEVRTLSDGETVVEFSPDTESNPDAAWVAATVGHGERGRYTVRLPLPVPGTGLTSDKNGNFAVNFDTKTMELDSKGAISVKGVAPKSGVVFVSTVDKLVNGLTRFKFNKTTSGAVMACDGMLVAPDHYPVSSESPLPAGDIVVPAVNKWITVDAILTFTVKKFNRSIWSYNCRFSVITDDGNRYDYPIILNTTEHITVVHCTVSLYDPDTNHPTRIYTGIQWDRSDDDPEELDAEQPVISCEAKIAVTAN